MIMIGNAAPLPEVARSLGFTQPATFRMLYNGRSPAQRVGARWYVAAADLPALRKLAKRHD